MKHMLRLCVLFVVVLMLPSFAMAGTSRSPAKDTTCMANAGGACGNGFGITPQSSLNPGGSCVVMQISLIGWDLAALSGPITSAELTLTTYNVSGAPTGVPVEFELFAPVSHDWTEDGQSPGSSGTTLATTAVLLTNGQTPQTVIFGGSANPGDADTLGAHFESLRTTGSATVGVRITDGCSPSTIVFFNDREDTGELPGGAEATEPDLLLFTPTAVNLQNFRATTGQPATWLLLVVGIVAAAFSFKWVRSLQTGWLKQRQADAW